MERLFKNGADIICSDIPIYFEGCFKGAACLAVYPGINDLLSPFDTIDNLIEVVKWAVNNSASVSDIAAMFFNRPVYLLALVLICIDVCILLLLLVFAVYGAMSLIKRKAVEWCIPLMLIGVLLYMIAVHMHPVGLGAYPRFRFAYEYIIFIFASAGLYALVEKRHKIEKLNK